MLMSIIKMQSSDNLLLDLKFFFQIQGGYWFLGPLMCDIYNASDVACSTASILLLAVISFDR